MIISEIDPVARLPQEALCAEEGINQKVAEHATEFFQGGKDVNFVRDGAWTAAAVRNITITGATVAPVNSAASLSSSMVSSSFVEPLCAQFFFGACAMLFLTLIEMFYQKSQGKEVNVSKMMAPVTAAALAIPMWNLGQLIGTHLGSMKSSALWHGASIAGGLVAAPFTGVFEGFTQWIVKYGFDYFTNPETREKWAQGPSLMTKLLFKELLLNITIGAIPGAVWQLVYFFAVPAILAACGPVGWAILGAALTVAVAVMISNYLCNRAVQNVSTRIDQAMGWSAQIEALEELAKNAIKKRKVEQQNEGFRPLNPEFISWNSLLENAS